MDYRNIDNDYDLYLYVGRYYKDEISLVQLNYILSDKGYSSKEIECAISDYYYAYFHVYFLLNTIIFPFICFLLLGYLLYKTFF